MAIATINPTANQTPDAGQGGLAVTGATNTGHGSTSVSSAGSGDSDLKTCRWFTFQTPPGNPTLFTLKADWAITSASLNGFGATNDFNISYSINGGSNWTIAVSRSGLTGPDSGSISVNITLPQAVSQIQVRDIFATSTVDVGESALIIGSVSNIRIDAALANQGILAGGM